MLTDEEIKTLFDQPDMSWISFARAVIAAYEAKLNSAEPVAVIITTNQGDQLDWDTDGWDQKWHSVPLFEHPAPIPENYALIPIAPTEAILEAINGATSLEQCYANILAAARSK